MSTRSSKRFSLAVLRKRFRQGYVRLLRSPGAPREVAGGMALGLFIALLPIMGAQMPIAVVCAEIIRRLSGVKLSRVAAAAGVWLTNPITAAPIYGVAYLVGVPFTRWIMPMRHQDAAAAVAEMASDRPAAIEIVVSLVIGGVILGIPAAIAGYWVTHGLVTRYQLRRAHRRAQIDQTRPPLVA